MAVAPGLAVAVALQPKKPLALVFAATPPAPGQGPVGEATLEVATLPRPVTEPLGLGTKDGALEGPAAVTYALPAGSKRLRLGLSRDLVAVLATGGRVLSVVATDEDAAAETLDSDADTLTLLHTGAGFGRFSIETVAAEPRILAEDGPLELVLAESGTLRLRVTGTEAGMLHLRGALSEATFVADDGAGGAGPRRRGRPAPGPCSCATVPGRSWPGRSVRETGAQAPWELRRRSRAGDRVAPDPRPRRGRASPRDRSHGADPPPASLGHAARDRAPPTRRVAGDGRPHRGDHARRPAARGPLRAAAAALSRPPPRRDRLPAGDAHGAHRRRAGAGSPPGSRKLARVRVRREGGRAHRPRRARQRRGGGGHALRRVGPAARGRGVADAHPRARAVRPRRPRSRRRSGRARASRPGRRPSTLDRSAPRGGAAVLRARGRAAHVLEPVCRGRA